MVALQCCLELNLDDFDNDVTSSPALDAVEIKDTVVAGHDFDIDVTLSPRTV
jgi:hypothetical protein